MDSSAHAWWLTVPRYPMRCNQCGHRAEIVAYRHFDQAALCEPCVEHQGIEPLPSKRYLAVYGPRPKPDPPAVPKSKQRKRRKRKSQGGWPAKKHTRQWAGPDFAVVEEAMSRKR